MNIARMEKFEQLWSARHDLPAESLAQYRFESREGYRLPELAAHYRTFIETWDLATAEAAEPCDGCFMAEAESMRDDASRYRWLRDKDQLDPRYQHEALTIAFADLTGGALDCVVDSIMRLDK